MSTSTIDLAEILEDRRADLADIEAGREALVETAKEEYGSYAEVPNEMEQKFDELESAKVEAQASVEALEDVVEAHDDTAFTVRKLSGGDVADIQDEIAEQSFDFDIQNQTANGVPKAGYGEILWTRRSVVDAPDWVEDTKSDTGRVIHENDPANLPWKVFDVLSDAIDNWNTVGDIELGNSSLREEMESDN